MAGRELIRRSPRTVRSAARSALAAGRTTRRTARALRLRCVRSTLRVLPVAVAEDLVVHDGLSLNIRVRLPRSARERAAELVLARKGQELVTPLTRDAGCLSVLPADGPGKWLLRLRLRGRDGRVSHRPIYGVATSGLLDGPTVPAVRHPDTGARYTLGTTVRGRAWLAVDSPQPWAEVTRVVTGWDGVAISGRLVPPGTASGSTAEAELVHHRQRLRLPVALDGDRFTIMVPGTAVATPGATWQLFLIAGGMPPLPVGRHLHDLRRPDQVIKYPARLIPVDSVRSLRVKPRYSAHGRLLLTCSRPEDPA